MNVEGSAVDAVVLGLDGFRVLEARQVGVELERVMETTATRAWCRDCGVRAWSKERASVLVRDVDGVRPAGAAAVGKAALALPRSGCPAGRGPSRPPLHVGM